MTGALFACSNPSNGDGLFHIGANPNNTIITAALLRKKSAEFEYEQPDSHCSMWNLTIKRPRPRAGTIKPYSMPFAVPAALYCRRNDHGKALTVLNDFILDGANPTTFDANAGREHPGYVHHQTGCCLFTHHQYHYYSAALRNQIPMTTVPVVQLNTFYNWTWIKPAGALTLAARPIRLRLRQPACCMLNGVLNDGGKNVND
jgi:hypothetical protein